MTSALRFRNPPPRPPHDPSWMILDGENGGWPVSDASSNVAVSPIDCALDRFRYDHLPLGPASVQVTGYDAGGVILLQGATQVDLTSDAPATAAPLDLE